MRGRNRPYVDRECRPLVEGLEAGALLALAVAGATYGSEYFAEARLDVDGTLDPTLGSGGAATSSPISA